jgi:hypothetical protein
MVGLSAFVLIILVTPYGPGLRDDSYTYLSAAENIAEDSIYARPSAFDDPNPVTNFPPGYSSILAAPIMFGADPVHTGRYLNAFLFALLVFSAAFLVHETTKNWTISIIASALIITSPLLIKEFTWVQSEPLFITILIIGTYFLIALFRSKGDLHFMLLASTLFAFLFLTRYAGLSFIISGLLSVLITPYADLRKRLLQGGLFATLSSLPTGLFLIRNVVVTGNLTNRPPPFWHPLEPQAWLEGLQGILMWFIPDRLVLSFNDLTTWISFGILCVGISVLSLGAIRAASKAARPEDTRNTAIMIQMLSIHMIIYGFFVILTVTFLDILTPLNDRILSPLFLLLVLDAALIGHLIFSRVHKIGPILFFFFALIFISFQTYRSINLGVSLRKNGQGYSETNWRDSESLSYVCQLPDVPIYSNDLPAIYFHCNRLAKSIPFPTNLASQVPNYEYLTEMATLRKDLKENEGYLVFLGWYGEERIERLSLTSLIEELRVVKLFNDGLILSY